MPWHNKPRQNPSNFVEELSTVLQESQLPTPAQFAEFTVREKLQCGAGIEAGDDLASPFSPACPGVNEDRRSRFHAAPLSRRAKAWAVGDSVRPYL